MSMTQYLATIDDSILMTPEVFLDLLKKFRHNRNLRFGFSKKHTGDIQEYRRKAGLSKNESSIPSNLYNLPVTWNTDETYVK